MKLKAKEYLESQKKVTRDKLVIRMSFLKEKGLGTEVINRDRFIKKLNADIRKANYRLACIAAQEKLNADRAQAKMERLSDKKDDPDKPPAKIAKDAPAKKEKKAKKEAPPPASVEQE